MLLPDLVKCGAYKALEFGSLDLYWSTSTHPLDPTLLFLNFLVYSGNNAIWIPSLGWFLVVLTSTPNKVVLFGFWNSMVATFLGTPNMDPDGIVTTLLIGELLLLLKLLRTNAWILRSIFLTTKVFGLNSKNKSDNKNKVVWNQPKWDVPSWLTKDERIELLNVTWSRETMNAPCFRSFAQVSQVPHRFDKQNGIYFSGVSTTVLSPLIKNCTTNHHVLLTRKENCRPCSDNLAVRPKAVWPFFNGWMMRSVTDPTRLQVKGSVSCGEELPGCLSADVCVPSNICHQSLCWKKFSWTRQLIPLWHASLKTSVLLKTISEKKSFELKRGKLDQWKARINDPTLKGVSSWVKKKQCPRCASGHYFSGWNCFHPTTSYVVYPSILDPALEW